MLKSDVVIPGRAEGANPEPRRLVVGASGFQVRRCAAPGMTTQKSFSAFS
jgi:hypothetical protein